MDWNHSLNASRPTWGGSVPQGESNRSSYSPDQPWTNVPGPGTSRPAWGEPALPVASGSSDYFTSATNRPLVNDEELVTDHAANHRDSKPVDFPKLAGLWAATNCLNGSIGEFRADGPTSMRAAKTLGRGLSFSVDLVSIEERTQQRLRLRSPFVVYKKLRGLTDNLRH